MTRKKQTAKHRRPNRRALVLLLVLIVIAMMSLAAYTFSELMFTEYQSAKVVGRQAQTRSFIHSAEAMLQNYLAQAPDDILQAGGTYDNSAQFGAVLIADDGTPRGRGRFSIVAPRIENGTVTGVRYGLENESAKLNINALAQMEQQKAGTGKALLMALPGMDDPTSDAILDWLDTDSDARQNGAENDYYNNLTPPYNCKNGPIDSIEELLKVRGVTPELLFGGDSNRNGVIDPGEQGRSQLAEGAGVDPEWDRGWAAYLTVYGKEMNLMADGTPKININSNDLQTLSDDLNEIGFSQEWVNFIIAYRQFGPYTAPSTPANGGTGGGGGGGDGGGGGGGTGGGGGSSGGGGGGVGAQYMPPPTNSLFPGVRFIQVQQRGGPGGGRGNGQGNGQGNPGGRGPGAPPQANGGGRGGRGGGEAGGGGRGGAQGGRGAQAGGRGGRGGGEGGFAGGGRGGPGGRAAGGAPAGAAGATQEMTADQVTIDLTKPAKFQFTSVLDLVGAQVQFTPSTGGTGGTGGGGGGAGGQQKSIILKTPFPDTSGLAATYLPTLLDSVTTTDAGSFPGRININQAPRALLLAIPGMTSDIVDSIIANREPEFTGDQPDKKYETWIYTEGYCTLAQMKQFYPFVTTGGCVYRAQIVGFFDDGSVASRAEAIIDAGPMMIENTNPTTTSTGTSSSSSTSSTTDSSQSSNSSSSTGSSSSSTGSSSSTSVPTQAVLGTPRIVSWRDMTNLGRGFSLQDLGATQ